MSFDTSWDIHKYLNPYEPEEHWELRKKFMQAIKNKYPEEKVVCLSSTFLNIEVLGSVYSVETTNLIDELSKGVVEEYHERKKSRLQKVFVSASDAAADKVKGLASAVTAASAKRHTTFTSAIASSGKSASIVNSEKEKVMKIDGMPGESVMATGQMNTVVESDGNGMAADTTKRNEDTDEIIFVNSYYNVANISEYSNKKSESQAPAHLTNQTKQCKKPKRKLVKKSGLLDEIPEECSTPFGYLVLVEDFGENVSAIQKLERSVCLCRAKVAVTEQQSINGTTINIFLQDVKLASATDLSKKKARELAYQLGVDKLREVCYTIKVVRRLTYDVPIGKDFIETLTDGQTQDQLASDNKALKMMANMGWSGGGLGKDEQGIKEPIHLMTKSNRSGLGIKLNQVQSDNSSFRQWAFSTLEKFANSETERDLVFKKEFSNEERKQLHQLAARFNLKSHSYGKGEDRYLVISAKINPFRVVKKLLVPGSSSEKYELVEPTCSNKEEEVLQYY